MAISVPDMYNIESQSIRNMYAAGIAGDWSVGYAPTFHLNAQHGQSPQYTIYTPAPLVIIGPKTVGIDDEHIIFQGAGDYICIYINCPDPDCLYCHEKAP
jgi:hypothetical protein